MPMGVVLLGMPRNKHLRIDPLKIKNKFNAGLIYIYNPESNNSRN
jgi:hypothetical protein